MSRTQPALSTPVITAPPWRRLRSTVVRVTEWLEVREDRVVRPDGAECVYDHVVLPGSVTVLAVGDTGTVAVTRQWIYTHADTQWRLPAGGIESGDRDPCAAARRELAEETGLTASRWRQLGVIHGADSTTNHRDHVFLADGLTVGPVHRQAGEDDLEVHWLPFDDLLGLVLAGEVRHAGSAYAVLTAQVTGWVAARGRPGPVS